MNTGKTKVMVSAVGAGEAETTGDHPCGVCRKGVGANSIRCTACGSWVHRRCSGVRGSLTAASATFVCKRCMGVMPRRSTVGDGEELTVAGQSYEVVTRFCYLGDMLDAGGGSEAAVSARIRGGWRKFRELAPFLTSRAPSLRLKGRVYAACVRSVMTYGSETWATKAECEQKLERAERRMVRWMCGVSLRDQHRSADLRKRLGLEEIGAVTRRNRLRWYGHVVRKEEDWVKRVWKWQVAGRNTRGRPRKAWDAEDCRRLNLDPEDARNRPKWRASIRERLTQANLDNGR